MQIAPKFSNLNYKHLQAYLTLWHFKMAAASLTSVCRRAGASELSLILRTLS